MSTSHLLHLPAELRVQILEYLLVNTYSVTIASSMDNPEQVDTTWRRAIQPHISRTNHLLRNESLPIHYGMNTFEVYLVHRLDYGEGSFKIDVYNAFQGAACWLSRINTRQRAMIMNIVVCTSVATVSIGVHLPFDERGLQSTMVLCMSEDEVVDETCVANVLADAGLRHYRLEFEEV
ncbi:hypothetical protein LTR27_010271 [Elasticomyces elasticus]|nr:hypothetical protein LTR27_010271 [Elasticomyces elasticus]